MKKFALLIWPGLLAALISTATFPLFLAAAFGIREFHQGYAPSLHDFRVIGSLAIIVSPIVFVCFLTGAIAVGSTAYTLFRSSRFNGPVTAMLVAMGLTAVSTWLLFGFDGGSGNIEIILPLTLSGGLGGLEFYRAANRSFKPPPAPPS